MLLYLFIYAFKFNCLVIILYCIKMLQYLNEKMKKIANKRVTTVTYNVTPISQT